jgi:hypothetical protein
VALDAAAAQKPPTALGWQPLEHEELTHWPLELQVSSVFALGQRVSYWMHEPFGAQEAPLPVAMHEVPPGQE